MASLENLIWETELEVFWKLFQLSLCDFFCFNHHLNLPVPAISDGPKKEYLKILALS